MKYLGCVECAVDDGGVKWPIFMKAVPDIVNVGHCCHVGPSG